MWWEAKAAAFDALACRAGNGHAAKARYKPCGSPRMSKKDTVAKFPNGLILELTASRVLVIERPKE